MPALPAHSQPRRSMVVLLLLAAAVWIGSGLASPGSTSAQSPLAISSGQPPAAVAGTAYSFQFTATGGTPPYTWDLWVIGEQYFPGDPPELTWGLLFDRMTGVMSGSPMITGRLPISVKVTDAQYYSVSVQYDLVIGGTGSSQSITNSPPGGVQDTTYANFRFGSTLAQDLGCDPSLYFIEGSIPPGLTLNLISGDLGNPPETWGNPLTAGTYTFTIMGQRPDTFCGTPPYTNAQTFTISIAPAASPSSPPGASNWVRPTSAPVLGASTAGWDSFLVRSPAVIKVGGTFYMYYEGEDSSTHRSRIGLATSTDGAVWTKSTANPVLSPGSSGAWDSFEVRYPTVHFDGTTYRMWYWGRSDIIDGGKIGLATSSNGTAWTKRAAPVFGDDYGGQGLIPGTVLQVGGQFVMWYKTPYGEIGRATSPDGIVWTDGGTVMQGAGRPSVVQDGSTFRMWFMKVESPDNGGLAGSVGDVSIRTIGYASSPDGITWTKYTQSLSLCGFCIAADPVIPVFVPGPAGAWDRPGVGLPTVLKDGTLFRMWYTGGRINYPGFGSLNNSPFVEGAIGYARSGGPAVPSAPTIVSPTGTITDTTPTYTWNAVSTATDYYLSVDDSSGTGKIQQWYTASQAGCPTGTGVCSVTPTTSLAAGAGQWWVRAKNAGGTGPWSSSLGFTVTPLVTLTVTKAGSASGTVTSSPGGISCGATCVASFTSGAAVTLTPSPSAGGDFREWRGACTGSGACVVTMNATKTVTAVFSKTFTDATLTPQTTPIKAVHFADLREAINKIRSFVWQEPAPAVGGTARAAVLSELRNALNAAYDAASRARPQYTESITAGVAIKASHLSELRSAVRKLECGSALCATPDP